MAARAVGPYCPYPRDAWDDTCIHPPGCADVVAELHEEHMHRLGLRNEKGRSDGNRALSAHSDIGSLPVEAGCKATGPRRVGKHTNERVRGLYPEANRC